MGNVLLIRESRLSIDRSSLYFFYFFLTCWMRKGSTHLGLSFLDVFKMLMFSLERRTFWPSQRSGRLDPLLLACIAGLTLEEYRLHEVSR